MKDVPSLYYTYTDNLPRISDWLIPTNVNFYAVPEIGIGTLVYQYRTNVILSFQLSDHQLHSYH